MHSRRSTASSTMFREAVVSLRPALRLGWIVLLLLAAAGTARAHEMSMAELEIRETAPGDFLWQWTATNDKRPDEAELVPLWPQACAVDGRALHCPAGLKGELGVQGVGQRYSAVLAKVWWRDGGARVYTLTAAQPRVQLYGAAEDRRARGEIAAAYFRLGVEHILTGFDHLLFVLGLLFLVGFRRQLLWTITAFTAAHSLTLASAALGWLTLRPPPVEASIALSIVLVAGEALHGRRTLARRWPAALAFLFGLVHGLGFAGALQEIGLPRQALATALVTFNLGVEAGQLACVGAALLLWLGVRRWPAVARARTPALYGIGSIAAYWSWLRIAALLA